MRLLRIPAGFLYIYVTLVFLRVSFVFSKDFLYLYETLVFLRVSFLFLQTSFIFMSPFISTGLLRISKRAILRELSFYYIFFPQIGIQKGKGSLSLRKASCGIIDHLQYGFFCLFRRDQITVSEILRICQIRKILL